MATGVAITEFARLDGRAAEAELWRLEQQRRRLEHRITALIAAVDRSGVYEEDGHRSVKHWSIGITHWTPIEAAARLRCARMLRDLPAVADAFAAGELPVAHAQAIANTVVQPAGPSCAPRAQRAARRLRDVDAVRGLSDRAPPMGSKRRQRRRPPPPPRRRCRPRRTHRPGRRRVRAQRQRRHRPGSDPGQDLRSVQQRRVRHRPHPRRPRRTAASDRRPAPRRCLVQHLPSRSRQRSRDRRHDQPQHRRRHLRRPSPPGRRRNDPTVGSLDVDHPPMRDHRRHPDRPRRRCWRWRPWGGSAGG